MLRSIRRACPSSSSIMMIVTGLLIHCSCVAVSVAGGPGDGQCYRECAAVVKFRRNRHGSTEAAHKRSNMGETDALSWPVLGTRAAEKVENPLMIPGIDAAAVISNLKNGESELGAAPDRDVAGNSGFEIFDRIVDQVGENLLNCEPVTDNVRQR